MATIFEDIARELGWEDAVTNWLVDPKGFGAQKVDDFLHVAAEESVPESRQIASRPRTALVDKVTDYCANALRDNTLSLAVANEVKCVVEFTMLDVYGRVGGGGQHAMRQRQYSVSSVVAGFCVAQKPRCLPRFAETLSPCQGKSASSNDCLFRRPF